MNMDGYRNYVTNKYLEVLNSNVTWKTQNGLQINAVTGQAYKALNQINLGSIAAIENYDDPRWCTERQAIEQGWEIINKDKGIDVEYWVPFDKAENRVMLWDEFDGLKLNPSKLKDVEFAARYTTVYNAKDMSGLPELSIEKINIDFSNVDFGGKKFYDNPVVDHLRDRFMSAMQHDEREFITSPEIKEIIQNTSNEPNLFTNCIITASQEVNYMGYKMGLINDQDYQASKNDNFIIKSGQLQKQKEIKKDMNPATKDIKAYEELAKKIASGSEAIIAPNEFKELINYMSEMEKSIKQLSSQLEILNSEKGKAVSDIKKDKVSLIEELMKKYENVKASIGSKAQEINQAIKDKNIENLDKILNSLQIREKCEKILETLYVGIKDTIDKKTSIELAGIELGKIKGSINNIRAGEELLTADTKVEFPLVNKVLDRYEGILRNMADKTQNCLDKLNELSLKVNLNKQSKGLSQIEQFKQNLVKQKELSLSKTNLTR